MIRRGVSSAKPKNGSVDHRAVNPGICGSTSHLVSIYLRLQVPRRAYLHLQQIEVYAERSSLYPV